MLSICSISACAERDKNVPEHEIETSTSVALSNNDQIDTLQATEALQQIKEQIHLNVPIKMPTTLPIAEGTFLSATARTQGDQVEVIFMRAKRTCQLMIFV